MENPVPVLSLGQLAVAFLPVIATLIILWRWSLRPWNAAYALGRMLLQLILIGYVLAWIFGAQNGLLILLVLLVMIIASALIAVRTVPGGRSALILAALVAIAVGGGVTLLIITQGVLRLEPWYLPRYTVPLAGMIFANAMTAISLAAERYHAELGHGETEDASRHAAFQAAMIPVVNSLLAVGLVSLPGMMTGQILSGVSPLVAARYQIMVMCMIFASAGISTAVFLTLVKRHERAAVPVSEPGEDASVAGESTSAG